MKDFRKLPDGMVEWKPEKGDTYVAIGKNAMGKRFRVVTEGWYNMSAHNFYFARIYIVDGATRKRTLLKTVTP